MVVKTELCAFSEYRIYPGHGRKFVRRDGQPVLLSTSKCHSMVMQRKKPAKLMWTQSWRRLNKKGLDSGVTRKKSKKAVKIQRAIVGVSLDEIKKKTVARKVNNVATEAALKEVKQRSKAVAAKKNINAKGGKGVIPKHQASNANKTGGTKL